MNTKNVALFFLCFFVIFSAKAQDIKDFQSVYNLKTTSVKNQGSTGTCWCFATISFLESEAIRNGKPEFNLSEMYIVRNTYLRKANYYIRLGGKANFSEGGQAHDVINTIKEIGLVPEETYSGLINDSKTHSHLLLSSQLQSFVENLIAEKSPAKLQNWGKAFQTILDSTLGVVPKEVNYNNKKYSPKTYVNEVIGINPDDYIELTSYSHHPYYELMDLEVPDNWSHDRYYNVPMEDIISTMDNALEKGYTVAWDGDVSERGFSHGRGIAKLSNADNDSIAKLGISKYRQMTFNLYQTTDDHLMHVTGLSKDKDGNKYYLTKNSWGAESNKHGGFLYLSEAYVQIKTIAIMINKKALPKELAKKLKMIN